MEVIVSFLTDPYMVGLMIMLVILIYCIKGDIDFMEKPKQIWKLFHWLGCREVDDK